MVSKLAPNGTVELQKVFNATHSIAFVVTNSNFDKIGLDNLPSVVKDRENYNEHLKDLGITRVIKAEDSLEQYKKGKDELRTEICKFQGQNHDRKLFIYAFFSSHGVYRNGSIMA
jgi:hypothetical protein